jgi:lipoprotein NlpD
MKKHSLGFLMCLFVAALSGCGTSMQKAPVVERNAPSPAPAADANRAAAEPVKVDAHGMYTVRKNDTLIRIALDHGQNYRDLVTWNNLANPNDIKVDQVLRVLPPEHPAGTQTSPVSMPPSLDKPTVPTVVAKKTTTPRADKKPYSEANLAEMQKPDPVKGADKVADKADKLPDSPATPTSLVTKFN